MEVELAVEVLEVSMTVDEARQHGLAAGVDRHGAIGNRDIAGSADRLEPALLDHDHGILERRTAGAVNERAACHHQRFVVH